MKLENAKITENEINFNFSFSIIPFKYIYY